jgi:uncharacterized protein (TIGR02444 family)
MTSRVSLRFWRFAGAIYAHDGVARACLDLQDQGGADIPVLLFAFFCGADGRGRLDAAQLERAIQAITPWRDGVVAPLRALRRAMRQPIGGITDEALRSRIKRIELAAERRQMDTLSRLLPSFAQGVSLQDRVSDAAGNVSVYLTLLSGHPASARKRMVELLTNAFLQMPSLA